MKASIKSLLLTAVALFCSFTLHAQDEKKEKARFIYVLQLEPKYQVEENWTEEVSAIVGKHFHYLKERNESGQVIFVGRADYEVDNPSNFGIVVFTADDLEAAEALMKNDPAVKNGIMTAEVHPFRVALMPKD